MSNFLRFKATPVLPHDIKLPEYEEHQKKRERPRYSMRPQIFSRHMDMYEVFDTETGDVMATDLEYHTAVGCIETNNIANARALRTPLHDPDAVTTVSAEEFDQESTKQPAPRRSL